MKKLSILSGCAAVVLCAASASADGREDRAFWVETMTRIAAPVVENLARGTLNGAMPHRADSHTDADSRLEAIGRTFCGVLPWLDLPDDDSAEGRLRAKWRPLVAAGLRQAVTPGSPDHVPFAGRCQPLVDAAFLAQGLLNSPRFWRELDGEVKTNVLARMRESRTIEPFESNWLLFASIIEAFILEKTGSCDEARLNRGLDAFLGKDGWYVGDGMYSDGPHFALDGYNSFVIQPMLWDITAALSRCGRPEAREWQKQIRPRFRRYADIQERFISPEGSYPLLGRSICYRFGTFHHLAKSVVLGSDFHSASNGAIRNALTAVLRRQTGPSNFDAGGWLTVGFNGTQESLAEVYISRGSPYLACFIFQPLCLPPDHPFWTDPGEPWTQKKAWGGLPTPIDHAQQ